MSFELANLKIAHLEKLQVPFQESYFSRGSAAYCLLADGDPVFAGGVVNLQWNRGEAWITPNAFFHRHLRFCFRLLKNMLPEIAASKKFRRIQAVCSVDVSGKLFLRLGFEYEGTLECFGPLGEQCRMYAKVFQ